MRIALDVPTVVEGIDQPAVKLHENLERVYQRVVPADGVVGRKFPGVVRDLSTNGAFVAGDAIPLLSRVTFTFILSGYGPVEAIGWTLWRREEDCEIPRADGSLALLPRGSGVLFEAIPLDARIAIHKLVTQQPKT
jgi:hypothetical protein